MKPDQNLLHYHVTERLGEARLPASLNHPNIAGIYGIHKATP